jgi:hypothetical protein
MAPWVWVRRPGGRTSRGAGSRFDPGGRRPIRRQDRRDDSVREQCDADGFRSLDPGRAARDLMPNRRADTGGGRRPAPARWARTTVAARSRPRSSVRRVMASRGWADKGTDSTHGDAQVGQWGPGLYQRSSHDADEVFDTHTVTETRYRVESSFSIVPLRTLIASARPDNAVLCDDPQRRWARRRDARADTSPQE